MGQQIAAVRTVAEADVAFGVAVAVLVEVAEVAFVRIAAASDDRTAGEAPPPLQVQQGATVVLICGLISQSSDGETTWR